TTICPRKKLTEEKSFSDNAVAHNGDYFKDCPAGFDFRRAIFNIIPDHIMRTHIVVAKLLGFLLDKLLVDSASIDSDDGSCGGVFWFDVYCSVISQRRLPNS
ncbi:hypothetical protein QUH53_24880, partial [Klebsiella quasipneumoniae subsp. similipneumoniae]|uniref:hypothetical protein n=1 Tax=Klebsiella quasipneumoniae TaxID=1463165 RepID=UPI0025A2019C